MAIPLKSLNSSRTTLPPRNLIYGPPGRGKSTLCSEFPHNIFLDVEKGLPSNIDAHIYPEETEGYDGIIEAIGRLASEDHDFKSVSLDTLDRLEPFVWAKVCADNGLKAIEDAGYGKGYLLADKYWRDIIDGMNFLRRERGMIVNYVAHSTIERFESPTTAPYNTYDIRLHKRAKAMFQDEVDNIFFVNEDPTLKTDDVGFNKKVTHAEGGGVRWIYCDGRPSFTAKNRGGMPARIMFTPGQGYAELSKYFPAPATTQTTAAAA